MEMLFYVKGRATEFWDEERCFKDDPKIQLSYDVSRSFIKRLQSTPLFPSV